MLQVAIRHTPRPVKQVAKRVLWNVTPALMERRQSEGDRYLIDMIDRRQVLFIHIPKTAGTSISHLLYGENIGHRLWHEIYAMQPVKYRNWLKFAVIRDPVERFISAFDYLSHGGINEFDAAFAQQYVQPFADINAFADQLRNPSFREKVMSYWHFHRQSDYVATESRRLMVNRLVPFGELRERVAELLNIPPETIPTLNATPGGKSRRDRLSVTSTSTVTSMYARDFSLYRTFHAKKGDLYRNSF